MISNITTTFLKAEKAFNQEKYREATKLLNEGYPCHIKFPYRISQLITLS